MTGESGGDRADSTRPCIRLRGRSAWHVRRVFQVLLFALLSSQLHDPPMRSSHLLLQSRREGRWMEETLGDLMYLDVLVVHDVLEGSVMQDIANGSSSPLSRCSSPPEPFTAAAESAVNGLERLEGSKGLSTALGGSMEQGSLTLRDALSGPGCVGVLRDCLHEVRAEAPAPSVTLLWQVGAVDGVKDASGRWHCVTSMHTPGDGTASSILIPPLPPCLMLLWIFGLTA